LDDVVPFITTFKKQGGKQKHHHQSFYENRLVVKAFKKK
jgi:hypothetical protein